MLQSRLHFRIHSALQEIKHVQKQAKAASKRNNKYSKEDNNNSTSSFGEDSMEDSSDKDSSSSFETAPEDSGAEGEGNLGLVDEEGTLNQSALRETAV